MAAWKQYSPTEALIGGRDGRRYFIGEAGYKTS